MMETLAVENYRSLRHLVVRLDRLNIVTGANGSGKSSLYRALRLLADASRNGAVAALAREGGFSSTLWAGPDKLDRREGLHALHSAVRTGPGLRLGFAGGKADFGYAVDLGHPEKPKPREDFGYAVEFGHPPPPGNGMFSEDPDIKTEAVWSGPVLRPAALLAERRNRAVRFRGTDGKWSPEFDDIRQYDSMLSEWADPVRAPEVLQLRERIRSWRFYDSLRTDAHAPARSGQIGTRTPVLSADGSDLAAALKTIIEIGDAAAMQAAVDLGFPGSAVRVTRDEAGRFDLWLHQPGLLRPLGVAEISDGTLRYLLWVAALLTPRPPELLVLNEPETSLHPDLLGPLGQLIVTAALKSQVVVVSHSRALIRVVEQLIDFSGADHGVNTIELAKVDGQTLVEGVEPLDEPPWHWAKR
jgi:predicted ATPase